MLLLLLTSRNVIAFIVTGIMKGQMKSVYSQSKADNYMKPDSMQLTKKGDLFLYKTVDRIKKPEKDTSDNIPKPTNTNTKSTGGSKTHISSSGAKHGGGGGKF